MLEGVGALLVFVTALIVALLTERWQRRHYQADATLACVRRVLDSGRALLTAMNFARNVLLAHQQQGHIWDFQRKDFVLYARQVRTEGIAITMGLAELRVLASELREHEEEIQRAVGDGDGASARIVAFAPSAVTLNGRVAVPAPGESVATAAQAFLAASERLGNALDALVTGASAQHVRLLRFRWSVFLPAVVVVAVAAGATWMGSWSHEISNGYVVWTHGISGRVEVIPLPFPKSTSGPSPAPGSLGLDRVHPAPSPEAPGIPHEPAAGSDGRADGH